MMSSSASVPVTVGSPFVVHTGYSDIFAPTSTTTTPNPLPTPPQKKITSQQTFQKSAYDILATVNQRQLIPYLLVLFYIHVDV